MFDESPYSASTPVDVSPSELRRALVLVPLDPTHPSGSLPHHPAGAGVVEALLTAHRQRSRFGRGADWVFATARGTPYGHRNVSRRCVGRAAQLAGLNDDGWPPLRFRDLRHTFASHLIIDLGLDIAQVSRILGHARITITLHIYTHLFEDARHAQDIRSRMAASPFAGLLEPTTPAPGATVLKLR
jgi:integrase